MKPEQNTGNKKRGTTEQNEFQNRSLWEQRRDVINQWHFGRDFLICRINGRLEESWGKLFHNCVR